MQLPLRKTFFAQVVVLIKLQLLSKFYIFIPINNENTALLNLKTPFPVFTVRNFRSKKFFFFTKFVVLVKLQLSSKFQIFIYVNNEIIALLVVKITEKNKFRIFQSAVSGIEFPDRHHTKIWSFVHHREFFRIFYAPPSIIKRDNC